MTSSCGLLLLRHKRLKHRRSMAYYYSAVYISAKDFETSKHFYLALGFQYSEDWGGAADFKRDGFQFRLQNYYVSVRPRS
jgi:hypothetical protein